MKNVFTVFVNLIVFAFSAQSSKQSNFVNGQKFMLIKAALQNKIKGGWAGQTIGVTYGGPYEFR